MTTQQVQCILYFSDKKHVHSFAVEDIVNVYDKYFYVSMYFKIHKKAIDLMPL